MKRNAKAKSAAPTVGRAVVPTVRKKDGKGKRLQDREAVAPPSQVVPELRSEGVHAGDRGDAGSTSDAQEGLGGGRVAGVAAIAPITWRTERRKIRDLIEWDKNPRRLTQKQAKDLGASIRRFGYVEEVVLNADGKNIIGGHQRRRVLLAQALVNPDAEIDVRMPSRQLTDKERDELAIRLNRNVGEWDYDRLANEFDTIELVDWGFEPSEFGIEDPRLGAAQPEESAEPIEVFDEHVRVKPGDIWMIGERGSRVICGDATDDATVNVILGHDQIDFVFTSPPYNVDIGYSEHDDDTSTEDYLLSLAQVIKAFYPRLADGRCIGWNIGTSVKTLPHRQFCLIEELGFQYMRLLIWKKVGIPLPNFQHTRNDPRARRLTPHYQHEVIGLFCKGDLQYGGPVEFDETLQADVFEIMQTVATADIPTEGGEKRRHGGLARHSLKVHPAAFPTRLPGSFIQHMADVGAVVFDPFMGSGTTLLAAEALNRVGVGVEIDPRYVEVILRRAERLDLKVQKR